MGGFFKRIVKLVFVILQPKGVIGISGEVHAMRSNAAQRF